MRETTLCYLEKDGAYLMLHRNKKEKDPNEGKWIGVGGKLEPGETPEECLVREVLEETGLTLRSYQKRGVILFLSDTWEDEVMHLYTSGDFAGEVIEDCDEGDLKWISLDKIPKLNLWEGDRVFLQELLEEKAEIYLTLRYQGEKLVSWERTAEAGT